MPEDAHELAALSDGELWDRRDAYARDAAWAPPYVADELREAHLAENAYRADAVRAWHRVDAAADKADRAQARQEAERYSALAQEVGAHREALTEVAEARRRWHDAIELARQQALAADAQLRQRHPEADLPPLHSKESFRPGPDEVAGAHFEPAAGPDDAGDGKAVDQPAPAHLDVIAAPTAARKAKQLLTERQQSGRAAELADDLMRRRKPKPQRKQQHAAARSGRTQRPAATWCRWSGTSQNWKRDYDHNYDAHHG